MEHKKVEVRIVREDHQEFKIDGTYWKVLELEGFGSFENDISTVDRAIGDGSIITSDRIAQKDRTIVAKALSRHLNDVLRREVNSFFNAKMVYKVYITYMGITRWGEGKIYKYHLPTGNVHHSLVLTLTFLFPNPYLRSYEDFGRDIASVTPMIGFPYLCNIAPGHVQGVTGGIYNFAKEVILENDGDVETYCRAIFVAKGVVTNPSLIIRNNFVKVLDVMKAGDVIEMDFTKDPPTIKKNGVNCIGKCDRRSGFDAMSLGIGDTAIQYDADDGTNLLQVSIYYNKLYTVI